MHNKH